MDLACNLRFYRKQKEYTQEKVARLMNLDRSVISLYENGERIPSIESIVRFADIYNVTVDELIGRGKYQRVGEISKLLISVSDNEMEFIVKLLQAYLELSAKCRRF